MVIPKHFVPPILINAALGTVLWTSYAESYDFFDSHLPTSPVTTAALSGAVAGAAQAAVAAPAENVRLVLKGASGHSWSYAWKEVFHGTTSVPNASRSQQMEEVRQVRSWMRDVGDMAGRGWDGWRWGMAKDIFGKSVGQKRVSYFSSPLMNQGSPHSLLSSISLDEQP